MEEEEEEEEEGGLEEELEAARAIYGAEAVAAAAAPGPAGAARVAVRVRPRPSGGGVEFVRATLALEFPGGGEYPLERGPALALEAVQGLGDERTAEALRVLAAAAEDYRGLPQLLVLVAALEEFLDAENRPHGACPLCMEPFATPARPCVRLSGCYHAYCRDCFFAWAKWRAAEIEKNNRATAEERKVALSSLPTALHCPVCRLEIAEAETRPPEGWRPPAEAGAPAQLPADVRREAMKLQRKFKKVLERQRAKGGLFVGDGEEEGAGSGEIRILRTQLDNTTLVAEAKEGEPARGRGRGRGPRGRGRGRGRGGRGGRGRARGEGGNGRGRGGNGRNSSQRARADAAGH